MESEDQDRNMGQSDEEIDGSIEESWQSDDEEIEYYTYNSPSNVNTDWINKKSKVDDNSSLYASDPTFWAEQLSPTSELKKLRRLKTPYRNFLRSNLRSSKSKFSSTLVTESASRMHVYQGYIPNTITYTYEGLGSRVYNCKFNENGELLLTTTQHGTAIFDFSDYQFLKLKKVISCYGVQWAITDSDITSDNKFMVHSTMGPDVHLFDIQNAKYVSSFNVKGDEEENADAWYGYSWYRVFSIKTSSDGKELIAGTGVTKKGAQLQVLDTETKAVKHSIHAHDDDINSLCYVDRKQSSLILTSSDDGVCKLWDTRIIKDSQPAGRYYGHMCGIAFIESREDSRYFLSNSKDQSIKLWDLRKFSTEKVAPKDFGFVRFDYRMNTLSQSQIKDFQEKQRSNKHDKSAMTFWGHQTYVTLIRAHFSPKYITDQRYIYTGSADARVFVYDILSGEHVATLELGGSYQKTIRDLAWHPYTQTLITSDFSGDVHKWEYKDLGVNSDGLGAKLTSGIAGKVTETEVPTYKQKLRSHTKL